MKKYIKPSIHVIEMEERECILAGSGNTNGYGNDPDPNPIGKAGNIIPDNGVFNA